MIRYFIQSVIVVSISVILAFGLFYVLPDPAYRIAGGFADKATVESIRRDLYLDQPIAKRFESLIRDTFTGGLKSFYTNRPVTALALEKAKKSLVVIGYGLGFIFLFTGLLVAGQMFSNRLRRVVEVLSNTVAVVPVFILAVLLLFVSAKWHLSRELCAGLSLSFFPGVLLSGNIVSRIDQARRAPYTIAAYGMGLGRAAMFRRFLHELAPSFVILTNALSFFLIAGVAVVEDIFGIPGIGQWFLRSALRLDLPVLFIVVILLSVCVVGFDLINRMVVWAMDPRQRVGR